MALSLQCLKPHGRNDNKQNTNKNNALTFIQRELRKVLYFNCSDMRLHLHIYDASMIVQRQQERKDREKKVDRVMS